jgi:hypothetical protein
VTVAKTAKKAGARVEAKQANVLGAYKNMLIFQFGGTVGLAGLIAIILWAYFKKNNSSPPLLPLVVAAGMLGALFSALIRLYNVDQAGKALITPTIQRLGPYLILYALVPPVVGAIAAVVLYLVFIANYLHTDVFPAMKCFKEPCETVLDLMNYYWPKTPEDYGKALVWCFIAGFSERLVPDLLQSMASKQGRRAQ